MLLKPTQGVPHQGGLVFERQFPLLWPAPAVDRRRVKLDKVARVKTLEVCRPRRGWRCLGCPSSCW